jgi:hypothetical protein
MSSAAGQFSPLVEDRDDDAAVTISWLRVLGTANMP